MTDTRLLTAIDDAVDTDPLRLRDALFAALRAIDGEADAPIRPGVPWCPPQMLRVYVHQAIAETLGVSDD